MPTSKHAPHNDYYPGIDLLPGCPAILTAKEVAFICDVSLQTIHRMIDDNEIPANADGDILKSDLIEYITTHMLANEKLL